MSASFRPAIIRILLIVLGVPLVFFLVAQGVQYFWDDHFFRKRFKTFETGDTRYAVVGLLGAPDAVSEKYLLLAEAYREDYRLGRPLEPLEYLVWYRGEAVYVVGLDASGRVSVASFGQRLSVR